MVERIGPYEVLGELGRGGMGVVYRARRADLDREFALKIILPEAAGDSTVRRRFLREAQAAARLAAHPGIVGVHDTGEADGVPYLAMDFVDGRPLDDVIADGELTAHEAVGLLAQAARAVAHAHAAGVLHRDIKPGNLMVTSDGAVRVTDFGLAAQREAGAEVTRLTLSGTIVGTPAYMPPEQAKGQSLDARADVYALGATLYEALTGFVPFTADSIVALIGKVIRDPVEPPSRLVAGLPRDLDAVVCKALAKKADDRYASAEALAEDLERFLAGEPVEARLPGALVRATKGTRRNAGVIGAVVLLLAGGAGAGWWWTRSQRDLAGESAAADGVETQATAADLAAARAGQFLSLSQQVAPDLWVLIDSFHGSLAPPDELQAARERAHATIVGVAGDDTTLAAGWSALAAFYAGDAQALDTLDTLADGHADDAELALLRLWCRTVQLGQDAKNLGLSVADAGAQQVTRFGDGPDRAGWATRSAHDIALVRKTMADRPDTAGWLALVDGVERYLRDEFAGAAAALEPAESLPLLGLEASALRAGAAYQALDFELAAVSAERSAQRGWGYSQTFAAGCWLALAFERRALPAEDTIALLERGERVLKVCVEQHADWWVGWDLRGQSRRRLGQETVRAGRDPLPVWQGMMDDLGRAARLAPDHAERHWQFATGCWVIAAHLADRGGEALAVVSEGLDAVARSVALGGNAGELALLRARLLLLRAAERRQRAEGRRAALLEAQAAFDAVYPVAGDKRMLLRWLKVCGDRTIVALLGAQDTTRVVASALAASDRFVAESPIAINVLRERAGVLRVAAFSAANSGRDPAPALQESRALLQRLLELAPKDVYSWGSLGDLETFAATLAKGRGEDPVPGWRAAIAAYDAADRLGRNDPSFESQRVVPILSLAQARYAAGEDVTPELLRLGERLSRVAERAPTSRSVVGNGVAVWTRLQRWSTDPATQRRAGEGALGLLERLVKIRPDDPAVAGMYGLTYLRLERYAEALPWFERAVALAPTNQRYQDQLALVRGRLGK